ncbi:MAG: PAS-domain containing protein [Hyphomicrobiales bacterium]|nr:PAS-domain containing protein [Hyphomicrobiales bacterium]
MFQRFGIGARLLFAFCGISLFAVLAAAAALYSFFEVGKVLDRISKNDAPKAILSLELSRQAKEVTSAASMLLNVKNKTQLEQVWTKTATEGKHLNELTSRLESIGHDDSLVQTIDWTAKQLVSNLQEINDLVAHSLQTNVNRDSQLRLIHETVAKLKHQIAESITETEYKLAQTRAAGDATEPGSNDKKALDDRLTSLKVLRTSLEKANEHVTTVQGLILESQTGEPEILSDLSIEGQVSVDALESLTETFDQPLAEALKPKITTLRQTIEGTSGLFALLALETDAVSNARDVLIENSWLSQELSETVDQLVGQAKGNITAAIANANQSQQFSISVVMVVVALSLTCSILIVWLYVGRNLVARLTELSVSMESVAGGDLRVELPDDSRDDEIGRMTKALTVFRDTAVEIEESNLREIAQSRQRLLDAIESISEGFCYFDSSDKLVVANNRFRDLMYPGIENAIIEGTIFEKLLRNACENGLIKDAEGRIDEWVAERMEQHRNPGTPHVQQRREGQWIMFSERRTGDGGTVAVYSDITELKNREEELADKSNSMEQLSNQIAKYLSPQIYDSIFTGKKEVKVASHRKKLTVFFSDIAGFTEAADRMESEELTKLLNHYLTEMSQIALEHGATIDKYVGDAIVIFFGDPETRGVKEDAVACVRMAIAMRQRLRVLQEVWRDSGVEKPLQCRIGINTGFCTVGNFGSEDRMDYTIIGNGVNLASRLESSATPGQILTSYETYALVRDLVSFEPRGQIQVKGIAASIETYQVIDTFENLDRDRGLILEDQPNFKLRIDIDEMSTTERNQTAKTLGDALNKLGVKAKKSAKTTTTPKQKTESATQAHL